MKTNKILLVLAALLMSFSGSVVVHAEEAENKNSKSDIGFTTPEDGALTLLNVADFDFGSNPISAKDEVYKNKAETTTTVQDIRGTEAGWTVQVAEKGQLKAGEKELENAQITLKTPTISEKSTGSATAKTEVVLNTDGSGTTVLEAGAGLGNGVTIESFGKDAAILEVPGETVKVAKQYETTLTWTLLDQPANN
ncbi:WxL domain-containing protein [Candidatus Enterococcus ikei]|uniref:WxL domain-containing protein n=1 Tax=Candidatus Enterococcus ikei TaxID=2815326 RepID=A0ABS3GYK1_9ENTE|nr:WxL domain-containing protein [Enterococcus sp. DIV0869a]MBO0440336.1 WxL domain-containing protein [Enterococcus sp. DIV0869a]